MAKLRGHPNILRLHAVAFAGPKGAESDGFFLLDYCVSWGGAAVVDERVWERAVCAGRECERRAALS